MRTSRAGPASFWAEARSGPQRIAATVAAVSQSNFRMATPHRLRRTGRDLYQPGPVKVSGQVADSGTAPARADTTGKEAPMRQWGKVNAMSQKTWGGRFTG